jgi:hypothetical protein
MPELVKRRGGRPRSENPRSDQVMVRLTREEKAMLEPSPVLAASPNICGRSGWGRVPGYVARCLP